MHAVADADDQTDAKKEGSVFGASLLFAGTAIGAGMLALPAETARLDSFRHNLRFSSAGPLHSSRR